jgi:hypothetical protein
VNEISAEISSLYKRMHWVFRVKSLSFVYGGIPQVSD